MISEELMSKVWEAYQGDPMDHKNNTEAGLRRVVEAVIEHASTPSPSTHVEPRYNYGCPHDHPSQCDDSCLITTGIPNVGWKLVPVVADRAMIERRFDTRDWEASDYSDAGEQYEKWIAAASAPPQTRDGG